MSTLRLPDILKSYSAPSSSSESQTSEQYDWSGLDDHIKRQDAVGALRDKKFAALASGDVLGAQATGNQIRDLLAAVKANAPAATERNPNQITSPLVRVTSRSESSSSKSGGGGFEGMGEPEGQRRDVPAGGGGGAQRGQAPPQQQPPKPAAVAQHAPGATNVALPPRKPLAPGEPGSYDVPLPATPKPRLATGATGLPAFIQHGGVGAMSLADVTPTTHADLVDFARAGGPQAAGLHRGPYWAGLFD